VERDLELRRLAGKLRYTERGRIGEVEPEGLTGLVAIDGLLGGRHQLAVAQHDHDLLHPAVGNLLAVHETGEIQQHPAAALRGLGGVVVGGAHPGLVDHLDVQRLLGNAAHMAGDGQSFILSELYFGEIILLIFHFAILLLTIER
jgi:hypothetical protein